MNLHVCLVTQSCPTLCHPVGSSPPGCSVPGILQARILEWVAMPSSRGFFQTQGSNPSFLSPVMAGGFFTTEPAGKPYLKGKKSLQRERILCFKRTKGCSSPPGAETEAELSEGGVGGGAELPLSNPTKEGDWPLTWSSMGHPDQSNANQRLVKCYPIRMFRAQHVGR